MERANAFAERTELTRLQLNAELNERHRSAINNLRRADEFVGLLEINSRVRDDFFIQWSALGRRSLFELLAIEAEQFSLQSGYFTSLYDGLAAVASISATAGLFSADYLLTP